LVSLSPILSTISYVSNCLVENLLLISLGGLRWSFNIKFTEPSYEGYTSISTGLFKLKLSNSVSISTIDPACIILVLLLLYSIKLDASTSFPFKYTSFFESTFTLSVL